MSEPSKPHTVAVIPAFNDGASIGEVATRAAEHCPVIVVDDGSIDDTAQALTGAPVTVLRNPENRGKAWSLWRGFQEALEQGAEAVISLDADHQHPPEEIPRLIRAAQEQPERIIIAARIIDGKRTPALRLLANRCADFWISWAAGYRIPDTQSGYRVYPAKLLRKLDLPIAPKYSFVFESEALISAARLGFYASSVPVPAIYHDNPRPSHYRPALDTLRITRMVAGHLLRSGFNPKGLYRTLTEQPG